MAKKKQPMIYHYSVKTEWVGKADADTPSTDGYSSDHWIGSDVLAPIPCSDEVFTNGRPFANHCRYRPEQLMVASISASHMLSYLEICAQAGVGIVSYFDPAQAQIARRGSAREIVAVHLAPKVVIEPSANIETALVLHAEAGARNPISAAFQIALHCDPHVEHASTEPAVNAA
ncbi:MAG: OsmC family protein [Alphaproteobacteria bacterium]